MRKFILMIALISSGAGASSNNLDVDGNGNVTALTDGLLILRSMFGFTGDSLIQGAVGSDCTNCTAEEVESSINQLASSSASEKAVLNGWALQASNGSKMLVTGLDYDNSDLVVSFPLESEFGTRVIFARMDLDSEGYGLRDPRYSPNVYFPADQCGEENPTLVTVTYNPLVKTGFSRLTDGYLIVAGQIPSESLNLGGLYFDFFGQIKGAYWAEFIGDLWVFSEPKENETNAYYSLDLIDQCESINSEVLNDHYIRVAKKAGNFLELFPPPYQLIAN